MIKKPNHLTFGKAVSGLNIDETELSSTLTLRELNNERTKIKQ